MLVLTQRQIDSLRAHAESTYASECCGLLLGHRRPDTGENVILALQPLDNAWTAATAEQLTAFSPALAAASQDRTQSSRYWIDPEDMLKAQRQARDRNLSILGIYHSHPDQAATPSECDRTLAWPEYTYLIVSVMQGKAVDIQSWQLDPEHQFQPEIMKIVPASAATDRMPLSAS